MFDQMKDELRAIELLLAGIDGDTPLTQQGVGSTVDTFVAVHNLEKRLSRLRMNLSKAIINNRHGTSQWRSDEYLVSLVYGSAESISWRKVADDLEHHVKPELFHQAVRSNTRTTPRSKTLRVTIPK